METVYADKYAEVYFETINKIFITKWLPESANITVEEIKAEFIMAAELILKYKPKFYLSNNLDQRFVFGVEIQAWVATTIFTPCIQVGTTKFAILTPIDMMAELSTQQAAEEVKLPIEIQYFSNEKDALSWFGLNN